MNRNQKQVKSVNIRKIENGYTVNTYVHREDPWFNEDKTTYAKNYSEAVEMITRIHLDAEAENLAIAAPKSRDTWTEVDTATEQ